MRRTAEAVKDWKPCSVCGRAAGYVHNGKRYCVRNECQLVAAGMRSA
jgi:ribosomal protein S14